MFRLQPISSIVDLRIVRPNFKLKVSSLPECLRRNPGEEVEKRLGMFWIDEVAEFVCRHVKNEKWGLSCQQPMESDNARRTATTPAIPEFTHFEAWRFNVQTLRQAADQIRQNRLQLSAKVMFEEIISGLGAGVCGQIHMKPPCSLLQFWAIPVGFMNPKQILSSKETDAIAGLKHLRIDRSVTSREIELLENPGTLF